MAEFPADPRDRPDTPEYFMNVARTVATRATCLRRKHGAVLVDTHKCIVATGYNGAPSGEVDCLEIGSCWRQDNSIQSGTRYDKCYAVHAETNALLQAGAKAEGCMLYLYSWDCVQEQPFYGQIPCLGCSRRLLNAHVPHLRILVKEEDEQNERIQTVSTHQVYGTRLKEAGMEVREI